MPASNSKANYKTYEAQARLIRAIVAAHPETKWNYKEIAACYGSDMTEHALNHRFRRLRAQSVIIREGRRAGFDMKTMIDDRELPITQEAVDKNNIAKYFGQSTADGIQFQFRGIKKDADRLRQAEAEGADVASCLSLGTGTGSVFSTPSKPTPARTTGSRTATGGGRKRTRAIPEIKRTSSDEDDDVDGIDLTEGEQTPSKRPRMTPGRNVATPSRRAAARARTTMAEAVALLQTSSDEQGETDAPNAAAGPQIVSVGDDDDDDDDDDVVSAPAMSFERAASPFEQEERKPVLNRAMGDSQESGNGYNPYGDLGDGEI